MTRNNKILLAALAMLTAAAPMTALAAPPKAKAHTQASGEEFATGAIATINAQQVKLVSGETFKIAPGVRTTPYKAGDRVSVRFTEKAGDKTADQIMAARN